LVVFLVFICWSRIVLGQHYPLDVMAGLILGSLWGGAYWSLLKVLRSKRP
jgi:membrane-associated phospholipid phosphatase